MKPFRFAAGIRRTASRAEYVEAVRDIERLGYSAVMLSDHLVDQLAPISALGGAAAVTSTLRRGTFVFNKDLPPPAGLAQEFATLDRLRECRPGSGNGPGLDKPRDRNAGNPNGPGTGRI